MRKIILLSTVSLLFCGLFSVSQETEKIYLSGIDFEHPVQWDFMVTGGKNSNQWSKINVPSHWEFEGFGEYTYGRWYKELNQEEPSREEGFYKYQFQVPDNYQNKAISLVFGGAMTDTEVKINGVSAGPTHQGGFYEFSYDITDLVKVGADNLMEVQVSKHSENASVNAAERKADWWLFGGIYRPVWLAVSPKIHIGHVAIDAKADGTLLAEIELNGKHQKGQIVATLTKLNSTELMGADSITVGSKEVNVTLKTQFENIDAWTPESPNLYELRLTLKENGNTIHTLTKRIGFRTLEFLRKDGIYLNGEKIIMKGINRHTIWPESGRSTSKRISIIDAKLIKDMNMNAVRNHYPPDTHFLEVCDSLGIMVLDELAGWQNPYDTEVGSKLVKEMIERDVNHPSVIIWDQGNEGGWNYELDSLFYQYDPQKRIVIHPWADFDGWDTHHYPTYQTGVHRFVNGENVFFPTEFMHGTYDNGHGAGLEDFWDHFKESPLFAGGFMWAFSDAAIKRSDWEGQPQVYDSKGSLAPDGILGPYREKEGSFYTVKEVWSPIQFEPFKITPKFTGELFVSNEYLYTNLNSCTMRFQVVKADKDSFYGRDRVATVDEGEIEIPSILPKETAKVNIPIAANFFEGDWLELTAEDSFGREIYTWRWPIHQASAYADTFLRKLETANKRAQLENLPSTVVLSANQVEIRIDKVTGKLTSVTNGQELIPLTNGPTPVGMKAAVKEVKTFYENGNAVCTFSYTGGIHEIKWALYPDGRLEMNMIALKNAGRNSGFDGAFVEDDISSFGITFDYPEKEVTGFRWLGNGPYRVWKNRIKGTTFGLWEKEYNNTITGEGFENLIYPEFKGYHAHMMAASILAKEGGFKVFSESEKVFLRLFTPEEPKNGFSGSHPQPEYPPGDISFLYEIPAMRSFKPLEHQGPHSQPSSIRIKNGDEGVKMDLWFDFRNITEN